MTRRTATSRRGRGLRVAFLVLLFVLFLVAVQGRALAVPALPAAGNQEALPQSSSAEDGGALELLENFDNVSIPAVELSEVEVASVIAFLTEQDGGGVGPVASQGTAGEGSADAGKNLFTGVTRLSNGGPSCRACHSTAGIGGFGGGKLGPDLTGAYAKLGDLMIDWPKTVPPMQPIYNDDSKPLTEQEKVDLLAFFSSTDVTKRPTEVIGQLIVLAVVGVVVLGVIAQLIWRRRLSAVRAPMVSSQRERD